MKEQITKMEKDLGAKINEQRMAQDNSITEVQSQFSEMT